jgi:hypothetical protein
MPPSALGGQESPQRDPGALDLVSHIPAPPNTVALQWVVNVGPPGYILPDKAKSNLLVHRSRSTRGAISQMHDRTPCRNARTPAHSPRTFSNARLPPDSLRKVKEPVSQSITAKPRSKTGQNPMVKTVANHQTTTTPSQPTNEVKSNTVRSLAPPRLLVSAGHKHQHHRRQPDGQPIENIYIYILFIIAGEV